MCRNTLIWIKGRKKKEPYAFLKGCYFFCKHACLSNGLRVYNSDNDDDCGMSMSTKRYKAARIVKTPTKALLKAQKKGRKYYEEAA